ncbi:ATP-binding cassette domain-containing protein [Streptomyces sp. NPDC057257]|uniref:ATP-binding cassette domain-containing protein n=1 Tax=Streptomyces sp. NPDC057257 TaxID=3346071 RepID=UPI00363902C2
MAFTTFVLFQPSVGHAATGTRIELDDVCRRYGVGQITVTALDDVDLHVDEDAFVVVLGPSDSGKTPLLNLIRALDTPSMRRIRIAGQAIAAAPPRDLSVFQLPRSPSRARRLLSLPSHLP